MTVAAPITEGLNGIFLALTPVERWSAARRLSTDFNLGHWPIVITIGVIVILMVLLLWVSQKRIVEERKVTGRLFSDYADRRGLNTHQRYILREVAKRSGLKQSHTIFTVQRGFERGATKLVRRLARQQTAEASERMSAELSVLREKLGFQPLTSSSAAESRIHSSRQISAGKKLHIAPRSAWPSDSLEATVIKNNDVELTVRLAKPTKITFGEFWCVHCYFGRSVWEFDTSVISCDGDVLVLNHSDDVRFVNRRRFLRAPVHIPAFIARFPFAKTLAEKSAEGMKSFRMYRRAAAGGRRSASASESSWGPPDFVPALLTELGGPGLRIEAPSDVKVGDRVLVIFRLDEEKGRDGETSRVKIVGDIGEVKHTKAAKKGLSIAVELKGLSDSEISELIRATNIACSRAGGNSQDNADSKGEETAAEEPVSVQGA